MATAYSSSYDQYSNPIPTPTTAPPVVQTSDLAKTNYTQAQTTMTDAEKAIQQNLVNQGTKQATAQASDPIIGPALSTTPYATLLTQNPAAAYYRANGTKPNDQQLQAFIASSQPSGGTSALDKLNNYLNPTVNTPESALGTPTGVTGSNGQPINVTGLNGLTGTSISTSDTSQKAYDDFKVATDQILNGSYPLNAAQQQQIASVQASFDKAIKQQQAANAQYEGGVASLSARSGSSRYTPEIALGNQQAAITSDLQKVADLQSQAAGVIAQLKQGFLNDDYDKITKAYNAFNDNQARIQANIDKAEAKTLAFNKAIQDQKTADAKAHYEQVEKPIQDIAKSAAEGGASADVIAKINASKDVGEAIAAAGESLTKQLSGAPGEYQFYVKDAKSRGHVPVDFNTYQTIDANRKAKIAAAGISGATQSSIDSWVTNIKNGTAKLSDVPAGIKSLVSIGLANAGGNSQVSDLLTTTQRSLQALNDMVNQSSLSGFNGFNQAVGFKGIVGSFTGPIAGTAAADFTAKLKQVTNDVVLPNLTLLHGLGRVTDREFQALQGAITSLNPNESEYQFKKDLKEITDTVNQKILEQQALTPTNQQIQISNDDAIKKIATFHDASPDNAKRLSDLHNIAPDASPIEIAKQLGLL